MEGQLPRGADVVFEPDAASMEACGVTAPEALVTLQSEGRIFVPIENYEGLEAKIESDTPLGYVTRQKGEFCCACKDQRPEVNSQLLRIQASSSGVALGEDRWQKLVDVLGLDHTTSGLPAEQFGQLVKLLKVQSSGVGPQKGW